MKEEKWERIKALPLSKKYFLSEGEAKETR